jgi:hypothetical protein
MRKFATLIACAGLLSACAASQQKHIEFKTSPAAVEEVALGRVVVYRNGVAYYERRARVEGDQLVVTVPRAKVDDFLKSLTVVDAATNEALPVAFSRQEQAAGGPIDMTMQLPEAGLDLVLTYVTEAPAWKPSYRIVVGDDGKVELQGWAIVDNTSGEDWNDVYIGVGSSSALSFRYDLWNVRHVQRQTLATEDGFVVAPPTAVSPHREARGGEVVASIEDEEIRRPSTHPDYVTAERNRDGAKAPTEPEYDPEPVSNSSWDNGDQKIVVLAGDLQANGQTIVIEGYANPGEANADQVSLDRANLVRNQLIANGVPPAQVKVSGRGSVAGRGAGVAIVTEARTGDDDDTDASVRVATDEAGNPVGESHFESETAMTVKRGTSVMVSVVRKDTDGEIVYLYDPVSERGSRKYAFRAVRLVNPTTSTLETGPVTVYGDGRFIGEGMTEPVPPEATAVIPFALDRQVIVERDDTMRNVISRLQTLQRGVLTTEIQHVRRTRMKVTNRMSQSVTMFIRHTAQKGWTLIKNPEKIEKAGNNYLFEITLAANETRTVDIEEATPMVQTLDLHAPAALEMVGVYIQSAEMDPAFMAEMNALLAIHKEIGDHHQEIRSIRQRLADYRVRMDELHVQVLSLKAVKTKGKLMKHLEKKLQEISSRVQQETIDLVNIEEQLMMARIRYQDGIAEMSLESAIAQNDN